MFFYLASGVGQQRYGAADIALVDQARSARAQLALGLARLVAEVMPPASGIGLEPVGGLAQTLRRRPVRLQLGHDSNSNFSSFLSQDAWRHATHPLGADYVVRLLRERPRFAVTSFLAKT